MPFPRAQQENYLPLNNVSEVLANWTLVNAISDLFFIPTVIVELSTQSMKALWHSMGDRLFIPSLYTMSTINPWGEKSVLPMMNNSRPQLRQWPSSAASSPLRRTVLLVLASARLPWSSDHN